MAARLRGLLGALAVILIALPAAAQEREKVDLALVLAMDVSRSIEGWEYNLQIRGYADALRSPEVLAAIRQGVVGSIAVTVIEWTGSDIHRQVTDWMIIRDADSANRVANTVAGLRRLRGGSTSISGGILLATRILDRVPYDAARRTIDVSGDGEENESPRLPRDPGTNQFLSAVHFARDEAVRKDITINGLPILTKDFPKLDQYYKEHVMGGPGAFVEVASYDNFPSAVRRKLLLEISGVPPESRFASAE